MFELDYNEATCCLIIKSVFSQGDTFWTWCDWPCCFQPIQTPALLHWWMSQCHPQGWGRERKRGERWSVNIPTLVATYKFCIYTHTITPPPTHPPPNTHAQQVIASSRRSLAKPKRSNCYSIVKPLNSLPASPTLFPHSPQSPTSFPA